MSAVNKDDTAISASLENSRDLSGLEPWQWEVLDRVVYYSQRGTEIAAALNRHPTTIYRTLKLPIFQEELYAEIQRKNMRDSQTRLHKLEGRAIDILEEAITFGELGFPVRDEKGEIVRDKIHRERLSGRAVMKSVSDILAGTGQFGTASRPVTPQSIESGVTSGLGAMVIATHAAKKPPAVVVEEIMAKEVDPELQVIAAVDENLVMQLDDEGIDDNESGTVDTVSDL